MARMQLWHGTADAPRLPVRVSAGEWVALHLGTWPIAPGQAVWVTCRVERESGAVEGRVPAVWQYNQGVNSYWRAEIGPFLDGDLVVYSVRGRGLDGTAVGPSGRFRVGPKLHLALLWHQHQPLYRPGGEAPGPGRFVQPWVRLHGIRDYYSMAALVAAHPGVHLTVNLTPVLLGQMEEYLERGGTDRHLELTLIPAEALTPEERAELQGGFFEAHWHNQIFPHPRYKELFVARQEGRPFADQDLRDLQMWFNLAWFGKEFRDGQVALPTGEVASVQRFVQQERGFSVEDVRAMVAEQYKILRAMVPIHRLLQERGQIEISTTPFFHPILPLLVDSDGAAIDRPGARWPRRFAHPDDAAAQVRAAVQHYEHCFGHPPRGVWPAEGAVSPAVVPLFVGAGVRWIATDLGVLARSGRWGYRTDDPDVGCQLYRAEEGGATIAVGFRDAWLADHIGFHYQNFPDGAVAAQSFLEQIKERYARRLTGDADRLLTVVLDGENAWGAYPEDARPFLHALYGLLERDTEIRTVTMSEYLEGNPARGVRPHPVGELARVHDLATGSWIDEIGSLPGVDLGTWIGEPEENRAWELLGLTRDALARSDLHASAAPAAYEGIYAAEGSDWFWWFGDDQESGADAAFDDLFRAHLRSVHTALGQTPPPELDEHIVPRTVAWPFGGPAVHVQAGDRLSVRTNCPGVLAWRLDAGVPQTTPLAPAGGVMAGNRSYHLTLGPFLPGSRELRLRFTCTEPGCDGRDICCQEREYLVTIGGGEGR